MNFPGLIPSKSAKSDHSWIASSSFEPLSQSEVLRGVLARVSSECRSRVHHGGKPVKVVFDLDSTVFDVKPRTLRILKEFALSKEARQISQRLSEWCLGLEAHGLLYTLEESARANGIPPGEPREKEFLHAAFRYWRQRFFTHQYVLMDQPSPGAVDYTNAVVDAGGIAVFLTGRDWPGMGRGTRTMLEHWGFPCDPRVSELLMKPSFGTDDADFKDGALRELRTDGSAVALFDNEPANFHVFEKNFPEAWLVFYHSNCSTKEAKPVNRVYKIENFLW